MQHIERSKAGTVHADYSVQRAPKSQSLLRLALIVGIGVLILAAAGVAYIWFSGGNGQASTGITAPSLERQPGDSRRLFSIVSSQSEARFIIDETLLGQRKTVMGATNEVAGQMLIDFNDPSTATLGVVRINVRTLQTDNDFRNRALRGQILQADRPEYEFATFTPTELRGLPDSVTVGEQFSFQIVGNLNVHGVSRETVFDAKITPASENEITGTASAMVAYRDFGMSIPEANGVADVSEEVRLEIDFSARITE